MAAAKLIAPEPGSLHVVEDVEEELFRLFTGLSEQGKHGLGYATVHADQVLLTFDFTQTPAAAATTSATTTHTKSRPKLVARRSQQQEEHDRVSFVFPKCVTTVSVFDRDSGTGLSVGRAGDVLAARRPGNKVKGRRSDGKPAAKKLTTNEAGQGFVHQVVLRQDFTAFRSVTGNTGSVAWRSSFALAAVLLEDFHIASNTRHRQTTLLDAKALFSQDAPARSWTILELGAGTGVLSASVLSHPSLSEIASGSRLRWIATDQGEVHNLLERNAAHTMQQIVARQGPGADEKVQLLARHLDWLEIHEVARRTDERSQRKLRELRRDILADEAASNVDEHREPDPPDLVLVVDCIFNSALFPSLLSTLQLVGSDPRTQLLVACEIREVDMMRSFLEAWCGDSATGEGTAAAHPGWDIQAWYQGEDDADHGEGDGLGPGFVLWLASPRRRV